MQYIGMYKLMPNILLTACCFMLLYIIIPGRIRALVDERGVEIWAGNSSDSKTHFRFYLYISARIQRE